MSSNNNNKSTSSISNNNKPVVVSPLSLSSDVVNFDAQHQAHQKQHQDFRNGITNMLKTSGNKVVLPPPTTASSLISMSTSPAKHSPLSNSSSSSNSTNNIATIDTNSTRVSKTTTDQQQRGSKDGNNMISTLELLDNITNDSFMTSPSSTRASFSGSSSSGSSSSFYQPYTNISPSSNSSSNPIKTTNVITSKSFISKSSAGTGGNGSPSPHSTIPIQPRLNSITPLSKTVMAAKAAATTTTTTPTSSPAQSQTTSLSSSTSTTPLTPSTPPSPLDTLDLLDQIVSQSMSPYSKSESATPEMSMPSPTTTPSPPTLQTDTSPVTGASPTMPSVLETRSSSMPPPQLTEKDRTMSGPLRTKQMSFMGFGNNGANDSRIMLSPHLMSSRSSISVSSAPSLGVSKPLVVKGQQTTQDIWKTTLANVSTKEETIKVCFDEVPGKRIVQRFSVDLTPTEIKSRLLEEVGSEFLPLIDQFELKVLSINATFSNESLPLRRQLVMQACNITRLFPKLQLILKNQEVRNLSDAEAVDIKSHIETELEIFGLIGKTHTRFLETSNREVANFRREMAHYRLVEPPPANDLSQYIYVLSEPMPLHVPPKLAIQVLIPNAVKMSKKIYCDPHVPVGEVLTDMFRKYAMVDIINTRGKTATDFVLKVTGFREYILTTLQLGAQTVADHRLTPTAKNGDFALLDYDYIRQCISKQQSIDLTLTSFSTLQSQPDSTISFIDKLLDTTDFDSEDEDNGSGAPAADEAASQQQQQHMPSASMINMTQYATSGRLPITKVNRLFRVKIVGLRNINVQRNEDAKNKFVDRVPNGFVMVELYHGGEAISNPVYTACTPLGKMDTFHFPDWERDVWTPFNISVRSLPRAARACFTFFVTSENQADVSESKSIPLGWANFQLIDHKGCLRTGPFALRLWEDARANPIGTCVDNLSSKTPTILLVEFETFVKPVVFVSPPVVERTTPPSPTKTESIVNIQRKLQDPDDSKQLMALMQSDPLVKLTPEDRKLIYSYRHIYVNKPKSLAKFLSSIAWTDHEQTLEAYRMLGQWAPLQTTQALELLDAKFADSNVRSYAVAALNSFSDAEFSDFLLQLTQVLKYEPYHRSDLSAMLLQRALANRSRIGHQFFWALKSELDTPEIEERYGLFLEGYLRSCGSHRQELVKQDNVINQLVAVANSVKNAHSTADRKKALADGLSKLRLPERFQLPLDPRWEAKGLIADKCRYMDSKKLPLWLVFENVEPFAKPLTVIFKVGDDLRQDILTLQVIRIMDKIWRSAGLDLRLQPYKCVATGNGIGMIEVVLNANTIANINKDAGGTGALLEEKTLDNWLRECNPNEEDYNKAVETFILSCAGYVVATYVLGIGDRHADNIMITKAGHLFHIDFGHFLGNYKKKYGFKRERAPFIFTPQYMAIVGGKDSENFKFFVQTCCLAYNTLRKHTDLFINLFQLMLSTGIPELQHEDDIDYLRKALAPGVSDTEAAKEFTNNIHVALNTKTVLLNDLFHNWAH
ncbi:hypothetical protein SAMD00019534_057580 [Acytostelium subglobosum LB1]|uniref:hypothetical protein n=1 Tax=Acytostelium subglobosum LB1 TaxID=1410327 RepID=UPI000644C3BA|nr:hypothetical protein SAMD00019534_057580 [Acytostelium subglobosum LB1]GAM22583.1 hypothetical protein SAMD00019534_057580 [Acytostelium subglobosum LB1]|eukprot:XP_012754703.1 hypothetical protein SAMD00019534_057580 [Acytostelium subglobosum LB1]